MIELRNSEGKTIKVPSGARKYYESYGFKMVNNAKKVEIPNGEKQEQPKQDSFEKLLEKPISSWKKAEILSFAKKYDIDLKSTKSIEEARSVIKSFVDSNFYGES